MISATTSASSSTPTAPSVGSILGSIADDTRRSVGGDIGAELNSIIGDVADKLAGELGIKQWYSMHLMNMCEGTYTPNATSSSAKLNVSSCTRPTAMCMRYPLIYTYIPAANKELDHFDISQQLDNELQAGDLHLDLSDIGWPSDIQDGLTSFNTALSSLFILYVVGITTAGLNIATATLAICRKRSQHRLFRKWLASLSFLSLLAASFIITFVQVKAVDLINTYGNSIGVYAYGGGRYIVLTWIAALVMLLAVAAEVFGEVIASWNIPRAWAGVYKGDAVRYVKDAVGRA